MQKHLDNVIQQQADDGESKGAKTDQDDHDLPYLSMSDWLYYPFALLLYGICTILSLCTEDIGTTFDLLGAFGFAMASLGYPGILYLALQFK